MADKHTPEQRSRNMAAIRASNTAPEKLIRKLLTYDGYRYRLHYKKLPGSPDIVLSKYKTVIFIHGCFWHRHNCYLASTPKSNPEFWNKKFDSNIARDQKNIELLTNLGWKIILIWQCAIKGKFKLPENVLSEIISTSIRENQNQLIEIEGIAQN